MWCVIKDFHTCESSKRRLVNCFMLTTVVETPQSIKAKAIFAPQKASELAVGTNTGLIINILKG
jgi:hypothetical protein